MEIVVPRVVKNHRSKEQYGKGAADRNVNIF
jgi:hypothetical protein